MPSNQVDVVSHVVLLLVTHHSYLTPGQASANMTTSPDRVEAKEPLASPTAAGEGVASTSEPPLPTAPAEAVDDDHVRWTGPVIKGQNG